MFALMSGPRMSETEPGSQSPRTNLNSLPLELQTVLRSPGTKDVKNVSFKFSANSIHSTYSMFMFTYEVYIITFFKRSLLLLFSDEVEVSEW